MEDSILAIKSDIIIIIFLSSNKLFVAEVINYVILNYRDYV